MTTYVSASAGRGVQWGTILSNANFQAFCTRVLAALTGCGLVQTSDTGQINTATVTFPGANDTNAGYFILRFNDAQQATDPIFVKVFLGRGSATPRTRVQVQIGQGSNGAGTLTGTVSHIITAGNTYESGVAADPATTDYACHTDGAVSVVLSAVPAGYDYPPRHWFAIARTRDQSTGAFDGAGVCFICCGGDPQNAAAASDFTEWGVGSPSSAGNQQFCMAVGSESTDANGDYIAWPHFYWHDGVVKRQWAWWTSVASAFPTGANTFDASPYGTARRWLAIGDANGRAMRGLNTFATSWAIVMLWEA